MWRRSHTALRERLPLLAQEKQEEMLQRLWQCPRVFGEAPELTTWAIHNIEDDNENVKFSFLSNRVHHGCMFEQIALVGFSLSPEHQQTVPYIVYLSGPGLGWISPDNSNGNHIKG